jgi:AraC-like DNA-binding protein
MKYWYQKPHASLSKYVRTVLILEGFSEPDVDALPLFVNGMPALFCKTERDAAGNENALQITLFGKSVPPEPWTVNENSTVIAYFFKPFALASIFSISAATLAKASVDLENWNPLKTNALRTQILYAASTSQKIDVLDHLLVHQVQENSKECEIIQYATDQIMCNSATDVLAGILKTLNINKRTFQRVFKKYVGVSPNHYRRICQFQLVFTQLRSGEFETLTDIAYDNGFADQSHFIRSFREFTSTTPNHYLKSGLKEKK